MRLQALIICTAALLSPSIIDGRRLGENEEQNQQEENCPPARFKTKEDISLEEYTSRKWYVHEQAETTYLPKSRNYCVTAEYKLLDKPTPFFVYTIEVTNTAQDKERKSTYGGTIYAAETNENDPSKLEVAPGFLPRFLAGPYWIVDYDETEGYALVIGGSPQVRNKETGKCRTNNRWITSSGGLWIFTRESVRNDALIEKVKGIAADLGLDTSVLNTVDHDNCQYDEADAEDITEIAFQRNSS